jgi:hypothetical protein
MLLEAALLNGLLCEDVAGGEQDLSRSLSAVILSSVFMCAGGIGVRTAVVILCVSRGAVLSFAWYLLHPHVSQISSFSLPLPLPL